ncbi:hypothetical protein IAT40_007445 [Kwoniella sp. CBS 6097]
MPARVMSQLENTSAILGEYMLKGWTLTDLHCSECRITPLMREPNAIAENANRERIQFCALCDGRPEGRASASASASVNAGARAGSQHTSTQAESGSAAVPTTTQDAAAEIEATFASSTATARNQSHAPQDAQASSSNAADDAANSISSLLLRGYSLLGENCPNPSCRGIPLVGYPRKADGSKDGRRMCVCCEGRWVDESAIVEGEGMKVVQAEAEAEAESPRTKARRELYGLSSTGNSEKKETLKAEVGEAKVREKGKGKSRVMDPEEFEAHANESAKRLHSASGSGPGSGSGSGNTTTSHRQQQHELDEIDTDIEMDEDEDEYKPALGEESRAVPAVTKASATHILPIRPTPTPYKPTPPAPSSALGQSLSQTSDSLSKTLQSLSTSLERYAARPPAPTHRREEEQDGGRWFVDLKLHTEAIKDVLGVIGQVERARRVGY